MKLNYLSAAVVTALATTLTACGGSDDNNDVSYTSPTQQPAKPDTVKPVDSATPITPPTTKPIDPTVTDPTGSKAANVDNIDLGNTPTVVGQNYIRNKAANFDYTSNTEASKNASSIALGTLDLDTQNPDLTNIVVGYDGEKSSQNVQVKRFVGNIPNSSVTNQSFKSLHIDKTTQNQDVALQSLQTVNSGAGTGTGVQAGVQVGTTADAAGTTGLVASNATTGSFTNTVTDVVGAEEQNTLATRIFGNKYRDVANSVNNSYMYTSTNATADVAQALTPTQIKLNNVQYGRVSSNIDALAPNQTGLANYIVSDYRAKNADDAVSNYFYRGTGETSTAQMAALPKDAKYTYFGHALTYGLDNSGKAGGNDTPNAFGTGTKVDVLGNFVRADYTVSTGDVTGSIYNAVKKTTNVGTPSAATTVAPVDLVSFNGKAVGNTVIGESTRLSDSSKGLLRASFYGDQAQEMGGSVNSITSGYGTASWGGVFGAQRQVAPVVTPPVGNTNGWLIQTPTGN